MSDEMIMVNRRKVTCFEDGSVQWMHGTTRKPYRTFGAKHHLGYRTARIKGKDYLVHRLVARAFLRDWDESLQVDHVSGDKADNCPANLRMATPSQNQQGFKSKYKGGTSQYRGVSWQASRGKWVARVRCGGKLYYAGSFTDEIEAAKAYDQAAMDAGFAPQALNFQLEVKSL